MNEKYALNCIHVTLNNETTVLDFEPPLPPATEIRLVYFSGYLWQRATAIYCDLVDQNFSYTNIGKQVEIRKVVPSTCLGIMTTTKKDDLQYR